MLGKHLDTEEKKITLLEEMMSKIFTRLFVHRYREINSNIRMSCIESLEHPSLLLQNIYLKRLGFFFL
ncbi:sister-chromatide cohesion protein [Medicago truncatula]|uniref:Sister-chromatide cohesion protein n=1 Tax=Medicago truncatula TaxID=3880 RepID=A2Q2I7_MEDTR|nr:hypothetical protein MtrDRAFT_AC150889g31v2 [Medicago truncatula]AES81201.1 sister-chromatide cohesion protein [Medicago truncatula]